VHLTPREKDSIWGKRKMRID